MFSGVKGDRCHSGNKYEKENLNKKIQTPLHFSEVLSTVPSILFCSFISYYTLFFFLGLLCNNLYSFACYRCNHFRFRFVVLLGLAPF